MADVDLTGAQDFQVDCQGLEEDLGDLEKWFAWAPTEGFDIDGLICGVDEDYLAEITEADHAKGLCSEFRAHHGLLVNDSSSAASNNKTNSSDISNQNPREDVVAVPQLESNCQAQEEAKTSCENPDSKRLLRLCNYKPFEKSTRRDGNCDGKAS